MDANNPLSIFFNYGSYEIVDATVEGLGQGQTAELAKFAADATSVRASEVEVTGFASPEQNLPPYDLPTNRANAVKDRLDQLFSSPKPTITVGPTSILSGDPSTYPALRRADIYVVSRA